MAPQNNQNPEFKPFSITFVPKEELESQTTVEASIFQYSAGNHKADVRPKCVIHGHLDGESSEAASLLLYEVIFTKSSYKNRNDRPRSAEITLTLSRVEPGQNQTEPYTKCFEPRYPITVMPTTSNETREAALGGSLGADVQAKAEMRADVKRTSEFELSHHIIISGSSEQDLKRGSGRLGDNIVTWAIGENDKEKANIYSLVFGLVVRHPDPESDFKVGFHIDGKFGPQGTAWLGRLFSKEHDRTGTYSPKSKAVLVPEHCVLIEGKMPTANTTAGGAAADPEDKRIKIYRQSLAMIEAGNALYDLTEVYLPEGVEAKKLHT
ncbi:uncharacterized protein PV09_03489 [Verruconis gallopava]|uniref:Uncharacterized protein n=1 Tax=Verruconis gallopava TaxID=253628 RepID=A0A0D2AF77_9PEZI|nr:uncharacterized protein PV09_03489 [Verruconis gallopava]KIW05618.1 hypothetical protein PV09_03489 [Verruconis gallopava]